MGKKKVKIQTGTLIKNKPKVKLRKKKAGSFPIQGRAYVTSSFNNTLINLTDNKGNTLLWGSTGTVGFKGTRKATPFAASTAALKVAEQAFGDGMREIQVFVKGPGVGRESAIRALKSAGLSIISIADVTPIPHNGCRPKKRRRV
ncbi:30S ribosomal protein S11 [candidate division WWE3 bacterium CG06_land_8_20_14_3_00_42_16]|uniref:Small ribosomal subunit protein uS11 n=4 Tax=Katanobacteria TaxID=422282 RepID=A0A2M7AMQ5_UNCKA|nr:MAG: 30S ribosomal protein S11 [candidate division WWE3 bacterium CG06_land_8_20_14_3_00_42_16]PIZ43027.1 MAG: 30S ribosomal protein S11 [candidate division WWE3 bacterium CG_4_10_14_0_2_um_filter_42_8]PJA38366.1 MAG: 30S ribosomal protein S11 [candidate division WWE3 bacterium CG_4_9_14_3_um_filter_43_9]PJC69029.1 MAG: 30S ribosomal protein S11 [candidate division WWE3 bacterium CG_4_8_14_3_um_filter_42_11]